MADASLTDNEDAASPSNPAAEENGSGAELRETIEENDELDGDDLFGDDLGDEDLEQPAPMRQLDDEELDSGDDEGRSDRMHDTQTYGEEAEERTLSFMDADIARHAVPEPSDGEMYLLKVPRFLEFEPVAFNPKTFRPPTTDHHSKTGPSEHFSAYDTAMTTIRWRRSPNNPKQLQSNARILRWSDGSLTLQLASQPLEQYEINAQALAPPQVNPKKPTPTQARNKAANGKESYTYLVAPYEEAQVTRVTNKVTASLQVNPTASSKDTALDELQSALAKAASRTLDSKNQAISLIDVTEDPELARQRREAEFKQKMKQQKAREKVEMREREKATRRSGVRSSHLGLSIGGLEDEDGGRRGGARRPRPKSGLRRDWSDEEDFNMHGRSREDEYDEEDDFIAASDEEPEIVDDDEDEDDGIIESPPRRGRHSDSPKRNRAGDDDDEEEVVVSRAKRRRVVEDDDEDE